MRIAAVGRAFPPHYYEQETLLAALLEYWGDRFSHPRRLEALYQSVGVRGRHLAIPIERYRTLDSFTEANDAYIAAAEDLALRAATDALARAGLAASEVDHVFFTTVTGLATPSIEARIAQRLGLRRDVRRIPCFGLGCVAGAAGIARLADILRGGPDEVALLISVELCSLTLQRDDHSVPSLVASALFGDGAAACVLVGGAREATGPRVVASRSSLYPDTEDVMGWRFGERGFQIVLSAGVPEVTRRHLRPDVDSLLADHGLTLADVQSVVCHTGGPKVLEAVASALALPPDALALAWRSLRDVGNLSSTSVLLVLGDTIAEARPPAGAHGLLLAMGPGFCSELVLLAW